MTTPTARFAGRRLLGLFPHPDDEAYAAGGTLALCARGGASVTIASATRGEGGNDRNTGLGPGDALARQRTRELERSCTALGAAPPLFLDFPDGRIEEVDVAGAARVVADLIARVHPDTVITLGWDGVYGGTDHIALTRIIAGAVAQQPTAPRILHAVFPRGLFQPVWRALARCADRRLTVEHDPATLGTDVSDVDLRVDITSVRHEKRQAVAAHRSQLKNDDPGSFLWPGVLDELLGEEWFVVDTGPRLPVGATDPFAGL